MAKGVCSLPCAPPWRGGGLLLKSTKKTEDFGCYRFATKFPNYPIIIGHHYRLVRNYRRGSELLPVKRESGPRNSCAQPIGCSKVKGEEKPPSALACSSERGGQERSLWEQPDSFMM